MEEVNSQMFSGFEYSCLAKSTRDWTGHCVHVCVCVFVRVCVCVCVCVLTSAADRRGSKSLLRMFAKTQRGREEKRRGKNENKGEAEGGEERK